MNDLLEYKNEQILNELELKFEKMRIMWLI